MEFHEKTLQVYLTSQGKCPFEEWLNGLKDKTGKARVLSKLDQIKLGIFSDSKSVGDGVFELRIHYGPGYRVYFGLVENRVILILVGGSKSSQNRDILKAQYFFREYKYGKTSKIKKL